MISFSIKESEQQNSVIVMNGEIFGTKAISKAMTAKALLNKKVFKQITSLVQQNYPTYYQTDAMLDFDLARVEKMSLDQLLDVETMTKVISIIDLFQNEDYKKKALLIYDAARVEKMTLDQLLDVETMTKVISIIDLCKDKEYRNKARLIYDTARAEKMSLEQLMNEEVMYNLDDLLEEYDDETYIQALVIYDVARANKMEVDQLLDKEMTKEVDQLIELCNNKEYQEKARLAITNIRDEKIQKLIKNIVKEGNHRAAKWLVLHPEVQENPTFKQACRDYVNQHGTSIKAKRLRKLDKETLQIIQDVFGIKVSIGTGESANKIKRKSLALYSLFKNFLNIKKRQNRKNKSSVVFHKSI